MVGKNIEWTRLELDVRSFDSTHFVTPFTEVEASGIRLTTLAELGNTPHQRRLLYDLNAECSADIPDRGTFHTARVPTSSSRIPIIRRSRRHLGPQW